MRINARMEYALRSLVSGLRRYEVVVRLAAPASASMLSYNLVGLVDTLMVGPVGPSALGGVGLANALLFTVGALLVGTVSAVGPLSAQNEGAGQRRQAGLYLHQTLWVGVLGGLVLGAILSLGAPLWLRLLGPGPEVEAYGAEYLRWRALGLPLVFVIVALDHFMGGLGDTRTPMKVCLVSNVIHAVLTFWFVRGGLGVPAMGVTGAAVSTVAAHALTTLQYHGVVARLNRARPEYGLLPFSRPEWSRMRVVLRLGLPIGVQFTTDVGAWLAVSTFIGWIGPSALAASQIVSRLINLPIMMAHGLSHAASSLVGRHLGAEDPDGARRYGWTAVSAGMILTCVLAAVGVLWPHVWIGLFTDAEDVIATGSVMLVVASILMLAETLANATYGMLQGAGDTAFTVKATMAGCWLVGVPLAWGLTFPLGMGPTGVYVALGVQMSVISALYIVRLRGDRWLRRSLVTPEPAEEAQTLSVASA